MWGFLGLLGLGSLYKHQGIMVKKWQARQSMLNITNHGHSLGRYHTFCEMQPKQTFVKNLAIHKLIRMLE